MMRHTLLILENIRSAQNVGAIFRTADAAGVSKIYLTGITPTPIDRFGRKRKDVAKSALGAEETIPWEHKKNISSLINQLKKKKFQIIAIEQDPKSVDYKKIKVGNKIAFIVGAEVEGVSKKVLKMSDVVAEIPMQGKLSRNRLPNDGGKESLNVSVSLAIALFRILKL